MVRAPPPAVMVTRQLGGAGAVSEAGLSAWHKLTRVCLPEAHKLGVWFAFDREGN